MHGAFQEEQNRLIRKYWLLYYGDLTTKGAHVLDSNLPLQIKDLICRLKHQGGGIQGVSLWGA